MSLDNSLVQEKFTILTQSEEEFQKQMKLLGTISLESMVELHLNEELLKNNFRTITDVMKKQYGLLTICCQNIEQLQRNSEKDSQIEQMIKDIKDLKEMITKLQKDNQNQKIEIDLLKDGNLKPIVEGLKTKCIELEQKLYDLEQLTKNVNDKVQDQGVGVDYSADIQRLYDLINQLKDKQQELDNISTNNQQKNADSEKQMEMEEEIKRIMQMINKLNGEMLDKVSCDDFDEIINQLKMQQQGGGQQQIIQMEIPKSRDGNRIQGLEQRVKELEDYLKQQQNQLNNLQSMLNGQSDNNQELTAKMDEYFKQLDAKNTELANELIKLQEKINILDENKADKNELKKLNPDKLKKELMDIINKMKESISTNSNRIDINIADIDDLKRKIDQQNKKMVDIQKKQQQNNSSVDINKVQEMIDHSINELRNELLNMIKDLKEQLDKKDFEEDMLAYQQKIFQKIDEIVGALMKKLANKEDTKKALFYLEKKITELYLLINPDEKNKGELDALLVKRPLFWSCVSCDKDLDQFQGRLGDYKNWKVFPPKETSPERMGRFGVGYAQMMQNRKINIEKEKDNLNSINKDTNVPNTNTNTQMNNSKQGFMKSQGTTGLPEIHNNQSEKSKYIVRK